MVDQSVSVVRDIRKRFPILPACLDDRFLHEAGKDHGTDNGEGGEKRDGGGKGDEGNEVGDHQESGIEHFCRAFPHAFHRDVHIPYRFGEQLSHRFVLQDGDVLVDDVVVDHHPHRGLALVGETAYEIAFAEPCELDHKGSEHEETCRLQHLRNRLLCRDSVNHVALEKEHCGESSVEENATERDQEDETLFPEEVAPKLVRIPDRSEIGVTHGGAGL